jgi:hypothetical protein
MKSKRSLTTLLRVSALVVLLGGAGVWAASGARLGWTQTSTVSMQRDEITGLDYPVRHEAFIPGIEVPLASAFVAAVLAGSSLAPRFRRSSTV